MTDHCALPTRASFRFWWPIQVFCPAELEVGLRCTEIRGRSFVLQCGIFWKDSDDLAGDGTTVLVWLDYGAGKAVDLPPGIRRALAGN